MIAEASRIEVAQVRGRSRLIGSRAIQPLKILQSKCPSDACYAVISNYGGGIVAGDQIQLDIDCGPDSRFCLGTQAHTRVYKSDNRPTSQTVSLRVGKKGLAVICADPLVLHEGAIFQQRWDCQLAESADLVLIDWLSAGRIRRGESFAFERFETELRLRSEGELVLLDRLRLEPAAQEPRSPAVFGNCDQLLSIYLVGPRAKALAERPIAVPDGVHLATHPIRDIGVLLRATSANSAHLDGIVRQFTATLAAPSLLGFDPLARHF
ncbi:MAG: urease accessory protein [Rhodothermales bacterium]|jgi:urease accessory protein